MSKIIFCHFNSQEEAENAVRVLKDNYKTEFYSFVIDGGIKYSGESASYSVPGLSSFSSMTSAVNSYGATPKGRRIATARLSFSPNAPDPEALLISLGALEITKTAF